MADEQTYTPPWAPMDLGWWDAVAPALVKPWPREAVWFDLRYWHRRTLYGAVRPGRPALMSRWGWTEKTTRAITTFWDAENEAGPAQGQRRASAGPAQGQRDDGPTEGNSDKGPGQGSNRSRTGQQQVPPKKIELELELELDTDSRPAADRPGELPAPVLSALGKHEKKPLAAQVKGINARLKAGATVAEIVAVIEWAYTSAHKTAVFNREQGNHRSLTPWRPDNFDRYLAFATASPSGTYATESLFVPPVNTTTNDDDIPF